MRTIFLSAALLLAALCAVLAVSHSPVNAVGAPTENYTIPDPANDPANNEIKPQVNFSLQSPTTQAKTSPPYFLTDFTGPVQQNKLTVIGDGKWFLDVDINTPGWLYIYEYYPPNNNPSGRWLAYKWQLKQSGVWRLGPFTARDTESEGQHVYRLWFYSNGQVASVDPVYSLIYWTYLKNFPELKINSFTASPLEVKAGEKVTLSWNVQGAQSIEILMVGQVQGPSGSAVVTVDRTTDFNLLATGIDGKQAQSGNVTVTVTPAAPVIATPPATVPPVTSPATPPVTSTPPKEPPSVDQFTKFISNPLLLIVALIATAILVMLALVLIRVYIRRQEAPESAELPPITAEPEESRSAYEHPVEIRARLLLPSGMEITFAGASRVLGRADLARSLGLDELSLVSQDQFQLTCGDGRYFIEDTESTNGTTLNGVEIKGKGQFLLKDGDIIEPAGVARLKFFVSEG